MYIYDLLRRAIPVLWWVAIWGLSELLIISVFTPKPRVIFYITMIIIICGIIYFDRTVLDHF